MKLTKKLLAGLLAISMVATGSSAFAAAPPIGAGTATDPYDGAGTGTINSIDTTNAKNAQVHNVTGTAQFTDDISVDIEWKDLQFKFVRKWDAENKRFGDATWSLVTPGSDAQGADAGNAIKATNKSAQSYDLNLAFKPTTYTTDYTKRNYSNIKGKFYSTAVKSAPENDDNKIDKLVLDAVKLDTPNAERSKTAWLWLSGNPSNITSAGTTTDSIGNYGFNNNDTADSPNTDASKREVFGTVTVTLAKHTD